MEIKCSKCGNKWNYKGKSAFYATCPEYSDDNPIPQPITPKLDLLGANQKLAEVVDMDFENIYKLQDVKDRFDADYDSPSQSCCINPP